jgi:hypothetical protein
MNVSERRVLFAQLLVKLLESHREVDSVGSSSKSEVRHELLRRRTARAIRPNRRR